MDSQSDNATHITVAGGQLQASSPSQHQLPAERVDTLQVPSSPLGPQPASLSPPDGVPNTTNSITPIHASDSDSIELAWVQAAKKNMKDNHGDPFEQNNVMSLLRAEYINKRYNKVIKTPEK